MVAAVTAMAVGPTVGGVTLAATRDGAVGAEVPPEGLAVAAAWLDGAVGAIGCPEGVEKGRSTPDGRREGGGDGVGGLGGPKKGRFGRVVSACN